MYGSRQRYLNLDIALQTRQQNIEPDDEISNPRTTSRTRKQHLQPDNNILNPTDTPFAHRSRQTWLIFFRTEDPPPIRRTDIEADRHISLQSKQINLHC